MHLTWQTVLLLFLLLFSACGGNKSSTSGLDALREDEKIPLRNISQSSRCVTEDSIEVKEDLNQDGAVDVRKLYIQKGDEKILVCRESDLNYDGVLDIYQFMDDTGETRRDEVDLDFDGSIDVVSHWSNGKVFKQELDQNSDGIVDTIRYLKDGSINRIEGDMDQNGHIDYWEYYADGQLQRIGYDVNGDGKADRWDRDKVASAQKKIEETEEGQTEQAEPSEDDDVGAEDVPENALETEHASDNADGISTSGKPTKSADKKK